MTVYPESNLVATFHWLTQSFDRLVSLLEQAFLNLTKPSRHSIMLSTTTDLTRSKADLIAENALLRQQLIILHLWWPFTPIAFIIAIRKSQWSLLTSALVLEGLLASTGGGRQLTPEKAVKREAWQVIVSVFRLS